MTSGSSKENKADPELVEKIIQTLKSKGCFDQFRKEFIADADTKPAYHNLQQRVESYVSRFLNQQKWSPKLNKNQLRETLRRQINQSGMLNKGVERIVEQTINPKIMQLIKPKTDEVTCEHLNISLTEHKNAMKRKQQEQQEKLMKSPDNASIQSLLSINFNSPPPGTSAPPFSNTSSPALQPGQFNPAPPGSGLMGPTPTSAPTPGQFHPQLPGYSNTNPAGITFPGISQQSFPFLPHGWNTSMAAGFPPVFPGQLPFQTFGIPPPGTALTVPPPAAGGMMINSAGIVTSTPGLTKPSPIKGIKGLNALLGLPTPSEEPAPPGTVVLPDGTYIKKKRPSDFITQEDSKDGMMDSTGNDMLLQNIPFPDSEKDQAERAVNEQIQKAMHEELAKAFKGEQGDGDLVDQTADGKRQYRFAWDEDIQEVDLEDSVGSSDISSVHTSDLSHFEDSGNSSDSDLEDLENKLMLLKNKQKAEKMEEYEVLQETVEAQVETIEAVNTKAEEAQIDSAVTETSPVKSQVLTPADSQAVATVDVKKDVPGKPRKLLSLHYNPYDSDDEETREERKARIAKEKEDRYQRRLQRRAELEAKRKEREEEKLRQIREKLERAREAQEKAEREKEEKEENMEPDVEDAGKEQTVVASEMKVETAIADKVEETAPEADIEPSEEITLESTSERSAEVDDTKEAVDHAEVTVLEEQPVEHVESEGKAEDSAEATDESKEEMEEVKEEVDETVVVKETEAVKEEKEEINAVEPEIKEVTDESKPETVTEVKDTSTDHNVSDTQGPDTSVNTESSATATESSVNLDASMAEPISSAEKKKQKRKTKAELKAELKEQKVMERKSRRQRIRNKRYMSDEFVYKGLPNTHLSESYDETMVIEETVEMIEIDSEQQTFEFDGSQVELVEIPLPDGSEGHQVALETVEFTEVDIPEDGGEVLVAEGETYVVTDTAEGDPDIPLEGETIIEDTPQTEEVEVTMAETGIETGGITTRSRSKVTDDVNSSDQSDLKLDTQSGQSEGKKKRKRHTSQSSGGEPAAKKQSSQPEGRQLRHKDNKSEKNESKSRKSYKTDDLYKPRHSFARKSASSPPPLPSGPPPPPSEPSPPPLPPLPPPPSESPVGEKDNELPQAPESPDASASESDGSSKASTTGSRKRKRHSRSKSTSPKRSKRSRSKSGGSVSSSSRKRSASYSSRSSYSRKRSKSSRSRSRSLSSISSESRSRSRSRTSSRSRSYSRSRSRSRTTSGSRSVSRSRSRSISSISSKRSAYSDDSEERRRKARPLYEVDFGEAAKRARQNVMMPPFGPRGPGPMGPRPPMVPMGPRGPMVPGPFPIRGLPPMIRGPRGMVRGRYLSPRHMGPDGSPIRPPVVSPVKSYYPPGGPMMMPPGPAWDDPHRPRKPKYDEEDYYPPDDLHEGPGKTGITERGTLYREDKTPSPPPERRPAYTPPVVYREGSISPPIPTGITERGTLYREDTSPSPPPMYRRRMETEPSPPLRPRHRMESLSPSPPPALRRRTRSTRSGSYESISPSPPHHPSRRLSVSPPPHPLRRLSVSPPPVQRNTPPVLRRTRVQITGTPSPPSSGELTPSPPDLRDRSNSPVSPRPLGPVSPLSPRGPASPLESLTPSPPDPRERLAPASSHESPRRSRRHRAREPASPSSSSEVVSPTRLKRGTRNSSSVDEESVQYVTRETRSRHAKKSSKRSKR